jgi:zinc transport system permease protein
VLVALAGFFLVWPIGAWLRRRRALVAPFPETSPVEKPVDEEHPHHHGEKCGHVAVEHGDHVDYIHDGHRHAAHVGAEGEHYDEH